MENTFMVTRKQLETMIDALCKAECWKMEMMTMHPEQYNFHEHDFKEFMELEFRFRDMIRKSIE